MEGHAAFSCYVGKHGKIYPVSDELIENEFLAQETAVRVDVVDGDGSEVGYETIPGAGLPKPNPPPPGVGEYDPGYEVLPAERERSEPGYETVPAFRGSEAKKDAGSEGGGGEVNSHIFV